MFYSFVKEIEKDKIFYFALVKDQKTLIIKSPSSVKERSEFLAYSWSESKGNEGIQIKNMGGMLYDPCIRKEGQAIGFSRSHRASIDRIKSINISVPNIEIQNHEMEKVYKLEEKIHKL